MVGIVVISHGKLCEGIVDSVEMVAGKAAQLETVSLKPGMTPEVYRQMLKEAVERVDTGDGALVFVDIIGGTPFNSIALLSEELNVQAVTGFNMGMLVVMAIERTEEDTLDTLAAKAESIGKDNIMILKRTEPEVKGGKEDDDEDIDL